jgi:hypothetical protein
MHLIIKNVMQAKQGACSLTSPACKSAKAMAVSKADCSVLHRVLVPPAISSSVSPFSFIRADAAIAVSADVMAWLR